MDLAGTVIPDDEFHEEPHLEEAKATEEVPNAVSLAIMHIHKNLGHPSKELLSRALRHVGAEQIELRSELRVNSSAMIAWRTNLRKSHLPAKLANTYTEFNVSEWISLCLWTQTNKCLSS